MIHEFGDSNDGGEVLAISANNGDVSGFLFGDIP